MNLYQNPKFYALQCLLILMVQFAWLRFRGTRKAIDIRTGCILNVLFCCCTAVAVGTLFLLYPGNRLYPVGDSAAFIYIGKQMIAGKVPYLDCFDHKGPLLNLVQYAGLSLTRGSMDGLWAVEVVNMAVTLLILVRLCALASERRSSGWLALLITFIVCGWRVYEGGNFTEEYALPWISVALLVFYHFFRSGIYRKEEIILLGIAFSAVFLLRANMIAAWVACVPIVFVRFLKEKRFRDLGICIGLFLFGVLAAALPVMLYLVSHYAMKSFVDCYFTFNFRYTDAVGLNAVMLLHLFKVFSLMILPGMLALVISIAVRGKDPLRLLNLWCFVVGFLMLAMSGRDYPHYLITLLPILAFSFTDLFDWTASLFSFTGDAEQEPGMLVLILSCFAILFGSLGYHVLTGKKVCPEVPAIIWLKENTKKEDDILVLGNDVWPYLASDRTTENRFFYQTPPIGISEVVKEEFFKELRDHPSDVILDPMGAAEHAEGWRGEVHRQLLKQGYSCQQVNSFTVYSRPQ